MNTYCFIRDNETVFKLVKIVSTLSSDGILTVVDADKPVGQGTQQRIKASETISVGSIEELENPPSDLIKLNYVHPAGILHTLRSRFQKDSIYTSIGPILVALNPFKWIAGVYDEEVKDKYKSKQFNLSENPHVFATAHDAYSDLELLGLNQSLIISGESGAGKTEATKQCLSYLAYIAGSQNGIQDKILKASPILESWGNAKTLRNNNSSRFGKFIEVWFDNNQKIVGSSNTTYLLEKSRVVRQDKDERNYHVFYQLLQGGSNEMLKEFHLFSDEILSTHRPRDLSIFHYINQSGCITIDDVSDSKDFEEANNAFHDIGFTVQDQHALYRIIAGILHLGNITFLPDVDEAKIEEQAEQWFHHCADLFGVDIDAFRQALLFRKIQSGGGKRKSIAFTPYTPTQAIDNKDALSKEIYRRCFDWIVHEINRLMYNPQANAMSMLGVLDIFGFEIFQKNSFEQLCINLANESLQQHFNYHIFQAEMNIYIEEDVPVPLLDYKDNQDVLDLIMKRPKGLIPMLDEEGIVPRGSWEGFVNKFTKQYTNHARFKLKKTKTSIELGIVHYAGEVYYDPSMFLMKNKDTLSNDFLELLSCSSQAFITSLFDDMKIQHREQTIGSYRQDVIVQQGSSTSSRNTTNTNTNSNGNNDKQTVGKKFSLQLESLMNTLNITKPRYIRCIKPNQMKKPNVFIHQLTNEQLTYSGVFEAVVIMQNGYPFRKEYLTFRTNYVMLIMSSLLRKLFYNIQLFQLVYTQLISSARGESYYNHETKQFTCTLNMIMMLTTHYLPSLPPSIPSIPPPATLSREQCQLLIYLISLYHPTIQYNQLYIGKSKIFYRVNEHMLLTNIQQGILTSNSIIIQRYIRGYIIRTLITKGILMKEKECIQAIQSRAVIPILQEYVKVLLDYEMRILQVCCSDKSQGERRLNMPVIQIAKEYCDTLLKEETCILQLQQYWSQYLTLQQQQHSKNKNKDNKDNKNKSSILFDQEEKSLYTQLMHYITIAKEIQFQANLKGMILKLSWEENKQIQQYSTDIMKLGYQITVKEQYQQGLATKNEFLLEECSKLLLSLQSQGILQSDYCQEYEQEAQIIQQTAKQAYDTLVQQVNQALIIGNFQTKKVFMNSKEDGKNTATHYSLTITVDATSLASIVQEYTPATTTTVPFKCTLLLSTIKQFIIMRTMAKQQQWQSLWELYESLWNPSFQASHNTTNNNDNNGNNDNNSNNSMNPKDYEAIIAGKLLYLPNELYTSLYDEIKLMNITALTFLLIPKFHEIMNTLILPTNILYYHLDYPCTIYNHNMNNLQSLENELTLAKQYTDYFNEDLKQFIALLQEQYMIRKAIIALGDVILVEEQEENQEKEVKIIRKGRMGIFTGQSIVSCIQRLQYLPSTHIEYQYIVQYQQLIHTLIPKIIQTIEEERWKGKKGYLQCQEMKIDGIKKLIQMVDSFHSDNKGNKSNNNMKIEGKSWEELIFIMKSLYQIRYYILSNQWKECQDYLQTNIFVIIKSKSLSSSQWEEILNKYMKQIDHITFVKQKLIIQQQTNAMEIIDHPIQQIVSSILQEYTDYYQEIIHNQSYLLIQEYYQKGCITSSTNPKQLQSYHNHYLGYVAFIQQHEQCLLLSYHTEAALFIEQSQGIIALRIAYEEESWDMFEQLILIWKEKTNTFTISCCSSYCYNEFCICYYYYMNYLCGKELTTLLLSINNSSSDNNDINPMKILQIISQYEEYTMYFTLHTRALIVYSQWIYFMLLAYYQHHYYETFSVFPLGHHKTDMLLHDMMIALDKKPSILTSNTIDTLLDAKTHPTRYFHSIDELTSKITTLSALHTTGNSQLLTKKRTKKLLSNELLSCMELLYYYQHAFIQQPSSDNAPLSQEGELNVYQYLQQSTIPQTYCTTMITMIANHCQDRQLRILLLLAGLTYNCQGNIDRLQYECIQIISLEKVLHYIEANEGQLYTKLTQYYYTIMKQLFSIRSIVYQAYQEYLHTLQRYEQQQELNNEDSATSIRIPIPLDDRVHEYLTINELQNSIEYIKTTITSEDIPNLTITTIKEEEDPLSLVLFPCNEINLYFQKVHDLFTLEELLISTNYGQCTFTENTFAIERVDYEHLLERIEPIKRSIYPHSDRVDRCLFFLELVINLRKAVVYNLWDLTTTSTTTNNTNNTVNTKSLSKETTGMSVKRCLFEYKQALKFFGRTIMHNIPSLLIQQEFSVVEHEWQRRLLLHKFINLFQKGTITGKPFDLSFSNINITLLQQEMNAIKQWEYETNEIDNQVELYLTAAKEIISIRQQAILIQQSYLLPQIKLADYSIHAIEDYDLYNDRTNGNNNGNNGSKDDSYYHSLQAVLHKSSYLSCIIENTVEKVDMITQLSTSTSSTTSSSSSTTSTSASSSYILQEMSSMRKIMLQCTAVHELPFHLDEIELIQMDISERMYVSEVTQYFYHIQSIVKGLPMVNRDDIKTKKIINGTNYTYMIPSTSITMHNMTTTQQIIQYYQKSYEKLMKTMDELMYSLKLYIVRQEKLQSVYMKKLNKALASGKGGYMTRKKATSLSYKPSYILEYLHNSVVMLLHYYRAKYLNYYDDKKVIVLNRNWLTDGITTSNSSKWNGLKQNIHQLLSGSSDSSSASSSITNVKYSIPYLIKINKQYGYTYHPQVKTILDQEELLIEQWISEEEILLVCNTIEYQFTGHVGQIRLPTLVTNESNNNINNSSSNEKKVEHAIIPAMKLVITRLEYLYPTMKYIPPMMMLPGTTTTTTTTANTTVPFSSTISNTNNIVSTKELDSTFILMIKNCYLLYYLRKLFLSQQYIQILLLIQDYFHLSIITTTQHDKTTIYAYFYSLFHAPAAPAATEKHRNSGKTALPKNSPGIFFLTSPQLLFGQEELLLIINECCDQLYIASLYHDLLQYNLQGDVLQISVWSLAKEKLISLLQIADKYLSIATISTTPSPTTTIAIAATNTVWRLEKSSTLSILLEVGTIVLQIRTILFQLSSPPSITTTVNSNAATSSLFAVIPTSETREEHDENQNNYKQQILSKEIDIILQESILQAQQQVNKCSLFNWQWNLYLPNTNTATTTSISNHHQDGGTMVSIGLGSSISPGNTTVQTLQSLLSRLYHCIIEKHVSYFGTLKNEHHAEEVVVSNASKLLQQSLLEDYTLLNEHIQFILSFAPLETIYLQLASCIQYSSNGLTMSFPVKTNWDWEKLHSFIQLNERLIQTQFAALSDMLGGVHDNALSETTAVENTETNIQTLQRRNSVTSILTALHYTITTTSKPVTKKKGMSQSRISSKRHQEGKALMKFYLEDFLELFKTFASLFKHCYLHSQPMPSSSSSSTSKTIQSRVIFPGTKEFMELMTPIRLYLTQYEEMLQKVKSIKGYGKRTFPPHGIASTPLHILTTPTNSLLHSNNNTIIQSLIPTMNNAFLLALQEHANILLIKQVITSEEICIDEDNITGKIVLFVYHKNMVNILGKSFTQYVQDCQHGRASILLSNGNGIPTISPNEFITPLHYYYALYIHQILNILCSTVEQTSKIQHHGNQYGGLLSGLLLSGSQSNTMVADEGYSLVDYTKALLLFRKNVYTLRYSQAYKLFPAITPIAEYGIWSYDQYIYGEYIQLLSCQRYYEYVLYLILQIPDVVLWTLADFVWITQTNTRTESVVDAQTQEIPSINATAYSERHGNAFYLLQQMIQQLEDALIMFEKYYLTYQSPFVAASSSSFSSSSSAGNSYKNKRHIYEYKLFQFYRQCYKLWIQLFYAIQSGCWISVSDIHHALQRSGGNGGNGGGGESVLANNPGSSMKAQSSSLLLPSTINAMKPVVLPLIDASNEFKEDVNTPKVDSNNEVDGMHRSTVYHHLNKIQSFLLQYEQSFPTYLTSHLSKELTKFEQEFIYIQYEQYLSSTLLLIQCQGQPGELFVTSCQDALLQLSYVLERLGVSTGTGTSSSTVLTNNNNNRSGIQVNQPKGNGSKLLQQGWLSAKLFLGILSAYQTQQWNLLGQYVTILRFLTSTSATTVVSTNNLITSHMRIQRVDMKVIPTIQENKDMLNSILCADQIEFETFFQQKCTLYSLLSTTNELKQDEKKEVTTKVTRKKSILLDSMETIDKPDALLLEQACQQCLQLSSHDLLSFYPLRKELISFTSLFYHDYLLTIFYQDFLQGLIEQPAVGIPGELDTTTVKYSLLDNILKGIIQSSMSYATVGYPAFLYHACESLVLIRKGQYCMQLENIAEGISLAKEWLVKEIQYESISIPSPLVIIHQNDTEQNDSKENDESGRIKDAIETAASSAQTSIAYYPLHSTSKQFLLLAQQEITIAEEDLQQKSLIQQLKSSLQSLGIPDSEYPFNMKMIEIDALQEVLLLATGSITGVNTNSNLSGKVIIPKSKFAQELLSTVKIIYKLRSLAIKRYWKEILEYLLTVYSLDNESFLVPVIKNTDEVFAAWKIATVSLAVDLAYLGYSTGRICREFNNQSKTHDPKEINIHELIPKELINVDILLKAKQQFQEIPKEEWRQNKKIQNHEYSINLLYSFRQLYITESYQLLYDAIQQMHLEIQLGDNALINQCKEEITFLEQHCMYIIVATSITQALQSNALGGSFGKYNLSVDTISLVSLKKSFLLSYQIIVSHENICKLQRSAIFLYRIRKAILLNQWIASSTEKCTLQQYQHLLDDLVADTTNIDAILTVTQLKSAAEDDEISSNNHNQMRDRTRSNEEFNQLANTAWEKKYFPLDYRENESVEDLLGHVFETFHDCSDEFNVDGLYKEVEIAYQEMKFRQILAHLIQGIYSPGFHGVPGDIRGGNISNIQQTNNSNVVGYYAPEEKKEEKKDHVVDITLLEESIKFALKYPSISAHHQCQHFLRDAQLLYRSRQAKLMQDYISLQNHVEQAEEINQLAFEQGMNDGEESESASVVSDSDGADFKMSNSLKPSRSSNKSILPVVWEELRLFKFDTFFQIALFEFATEMKKEEKLFSEKNSLKRQRKLRKTQQKGPTLGLSKRASLFDEDNANTSEDEQSSTSESEQDEEEEKEEEEEEAERAASQGIDFETRINDLEDLLEFTRNISSGYPSGEFERLIEAMIMAIKLRKFVRDDPMKSPQLIIDQVAKVKQRDRQSNVTCYMSLLIFEISKLSNVLDFPMLLKKIEDEIKFGQRYIRKPIGQIVPGDISVEALQQYYNEAMPSLEIMESDENRLFMKLTLAIIEIRKAIVQRDFAGAMNSVVGHEYALQHATAAPLVKEELRRLRIEMENEDAWKLISYGLKTGRCLDIIAIAKMQSAYRLAESEHHEANNTSDSNTMSSMNAGSTGSLASRKISLLNPMQSNMMDSAVHNTRGSLFGEISKRRSSVKGSIIGRRGSMNRRTSRRVSLGIQEMMTLFEQTYLQDNNGTDDEPGTPQTPLIAEEPVLSSSNAGNNVGEVETVYQQYFENSPLISAIRSSVYALKRAVAVTSRVSVKSKTVEYYMNATKIILQLREKILLNQWDSVQQMVTEEEYDLPPVAIEEINAIREGLLFQRCIEVVNETILQGKITGPVYTIEIRKIQYDTLFQLVESFQLGVFQDESALVLTKIVKLVAELRKAFCEWLLIHKETISSENWLQEFCDPAENIHSSVNANSLTPQKNLSSYTSTKQSLSLTNLQTRRKVAHKYSILLQMIKEFDQLQYDEVQTLLQDLGLSSTSRKQSTAQHITLEFSWILQFSSSLKVIKEEMKVIMDALHYCAMIQQVINSLQLLPIPLLFYMDYQSKGQSKAHSTFLLPVYSVAKITQLLEGYCFQQGISFLSSSFPNAKQNNAIPMCFYPDNYRLSSSTLTPIIQHQDYYFLNSFFDIFQALQEYVTITQETQASSSPFLLSLLAIMEKVYVIRSLMAGKLPRMFAVLEDEEMDKNKIPAIPTIRPNFMELLHMEIECIPEFLVAQQQNYQHSYGFQELFHYFEIESTSYQYAEELLHLLQITAPKTTLNQFNINTIVLDEIEEKLQEIEDYLEYHLYSVFSAMNHTIYQENRKLYPFHKLQYGTSMSAMGIYERKYSQICHNHHEHSYFNYYLLELCEETYLLLLLRHLLKDENYIKLKELFVENTWIVERLSYTSFDIIREEYLYIRYSLQFHDFHSHLSKKLASLQYDSYLTMQDIHSSNNTKQPDNIWANNSTPSTASYSFITQEYYLFQQLFTLFDEIFSYSSPLLPTFSYADSSNNHHHDNGANNSVTIGGKTTYKLGNKEIIIGNVISVEYLQTSVYQLGCRIYRLLYAICIERLWSPLSISSASSSSSQGSNGTRSRVFLNTSMRKATSSSSSTSKRNSTSDNTMMKCPYGRLISSQHVPDYYTTDPIFIEYFGLNQFNKYSSNLFSFYSTFPPPIPTIPTATNTSSDHHNNSMEAYVAYVQHIPYPQESVFHILYFINHIFLPTNIQQWILLIRNVLIEHELIEDLQYYTLKGCGKLLSNTGQELQISTLYFQYLQYSIRKIYAITQYSHKYTSTSSSSLAIQWSKRFVIWNELGSLMYILRQCILQIQSDYQQQHQQTASTSVRQFITSSSYHTLQTLLIHYGFIIPIATTTTATTTVTATTASLPYLITLYKIAHPLSLSTLLPYDEQLLLHEEIYLYCHYMIMLQYEYVVLVIIQYLVQTTSLSSSSITTVLHHPYYQQLYMVLLCIQLQLPSSSSSSSTNKATMIGGYFYTNPMIEWIYYIGHWFYHTLQCIGYGNSQKIKDSLTELSQILFDPAFLTTTTATTTTHTTHSSSSKWSMSMLQKNVLFIHCRESYHHIKELYLSYLLQYHHNHNNTIPNNNNHNNNHNNNKSLIAFGNSNNTTTTTTTNIPILPTSPYFHSKFPPPPIGMTTVEYKGISNRLTNFLSNAFFATMPHSIASTTTTAADSTYSNSSNSMLQTVETMEQIVILLCQIFTCIYQYDPLTGSQSHDPGELVDEEKGEIPEEEEDDDEIVFVHDQQEKKKNAQSKAKVKRSYTKKQPRDDPSLSYKLYIQLCQLYTNQLHVEYMILTPQWTIIILLCIYYLREEYQWQKKIQFLLLRQLLSIDTTQRNNNNNNNQKEEDEEDVQQYERSTVFQTPNTFFSPIGLTWKIDDHSNTSTSGENSIGSMSHYYTTPSRSNTPVSSSRPLKHGTPTTPMSLPGTQRMEDEFMMMIEESSTIAAMLPRHPSPAGSFLSSELRNNSGSNSKRLQNSHTKKLQIDISFNTSHHHMMNATDSPSIEDDGDGYDEEEEEEEEERRENTKIPMSKPFIQLLQELPSFVWEYFSSASYSLRYELANMPTATMTTTTHHLVQQQQTKKQKNVHKEDNTLYHDHEETTSMRDYCEFGYYHPDITPNLIVLSKYLHLIAYTKVDNIPLDDEITNLAMNTTTSSQQQQQALFSPIKQTSLQVNTSTIPVAAPTTAAAATTMTSLAGGFFSPFSRSLEYSSSALPSVVKPDVSNMKMNNPFSESVEEKGMEEKKPTTLLFDHRNNIDFQSNDWEEDDDDDNDRDDGNADDNRNTHTTTHQTKAKLFGSKRSTTTTPVRGRDRNNNNSNKWRLNTPAASPFILHEEDMELTYDMVQAMTSDVLMEQIEDEEISSMDWLILQLQRIEILMNHYKEHDQEEEEQAEEDQDQDQDYPNNNNNNHNNHKKMTFEIGLITRSLYLMNQFLQIIQPPTTTSKKTNKK